MQLTVRGDGSCAASDDVAWQLVYTYCSMYALTVVLYCNRILSTIRIEQYRNILQYSKTMSTSMDKVHDSCIR